MTSLSDQHLIYKARYERLTEIGRQLNTTFDLDTLLHQIIEDVTELLHAEAAAILLADPDSGELSFAVASPISDPHGKLPGISVPIDRSIAGWVTTNGRPQVVNDVKSDPRWFPEVALVSDFETRNLVSVPLRVQDSIIGAVNTINKHDRQLWTDDDQGNRIKKGKCGK